MAIQHDDLDNGNLVNITLGATFIVIAVSYLVSGMHKVRQQELSADNNVQSIVAERVELRASQVAGINAGDVNLADAKKKVIESYNN
ncbi:MAG: hypothetical protein H8E25_12450 [Planctomycetes bacterium]|nr:hypothetical protein [Planctomycetota bacterium]